MSIIIQGDAFQVMRTLPSNSASLIFTDPPYSRKYAHLWRPLGHEAKRLLVSGGSLITLCGIINLPYVIQSLSESLDYYWCCAMLHKQVALVEVVNIYNTWKPILWFTKGAPIARMAIPDGISPFSAQKSDHRWQQAESWVSHFVGSLVPKGGLVVDPFVGTGTTAVVCDKLGISCIGIDNDPKQVEVANRKLSELTSFK